MSENAKKLINAAAEAAETLSDAEAARLQGIVQGFTMAHADMGARDTTTARRGDEMCHKCSVSRATAGA